MSSSQPPFAGKSVFPAPRASRRTFTPSYRLLSGFFPIRRTTCTSSSRHIRSPPQRSRAELSISYLYSDPCFGSDRQQATRPDLFANRHLQLLIALGCDARCKTMTGRSGQDSTVGRLFARNSGKEIERGRPYAEFWMGTHQSGPSFVELGRPEPVPVTLKFWVEENPSILGEKLKDILTSVPEILELVGQENASKVISIRELDGHEEVRAILQCNFTQLMTASKEAVSDVEKKLTSRLSMEQKYFIFVFLMQSSFIGFSRVRKPPSSRLVPPNFANHSSRLLPPELANPLSHVMVKALVLGLEEWSIEAHLLVKSVSKPLPDVKPWKTLPLPYCEPPPSPPLKQPPPPS
ncbi:Mannose-6-phosphate isomerase 2 [Platanthera guangdongensis]|uniref:Mannose-6-phosphate isomerase 2 n=1 Tax=Platanthera guangdongensis TaxID=2320717 RepID=A0ABR2MGT2_9ASPA